MAIGVTLLGTGAGSLGVALTGVSRADLAVGRFLVFCLASDNVPGHGTLTLTDGSQVVYLIGTRHSVDNTGSVCTSIVFGKITALPIGSGTITIGLSFSAGVWAATAYSITGLTESPFDKDMTYLGTNAPYTTGSTGTLSQAEEVCIAVIGIEEQTDNLGSWTTGSGYVSGNEQSAGSTSGAAKGISIATAAKVVSSTAAQIGEMYASAPDWAALIVTFKGGSSSTVKSVSDAGSTAETLPRLVVAASLSDAGSGLDAPGGASAQLAMADQSSALDSVSKLVLVYKLITESGAGSEVLALLARAMVAENSTCAEALSNLARFSITEISSALESLGNFQASLQVDDSQISAEALSLLIRLAKTVGDSALASEALGIAALFGLSDAGFLTDALRIGISFALGDHSGAEDGLARLAAGLTMEDSAAAVEALAISLARLVSDSSIGAEDLARLVVSLGISDSLAGVDALGDLLVAMSLSDAGSGAETLTLLLHLMKAVADTSAGADVLSSLAVRLIMFDGMASADVPFVLGSLSLADSLSCNETLGAAAAFVLSDAAHGSETLELFLELVKLVSDQAFAVDTLVELTARLALGEQLAGEDLAGVLVRFLVSEDLSGAEAQSVLAQIGVVDLILGEDGISLLLELYKLVQDGAIGADSLARIISALVVVEQAVGADTLHDLLARLALSDAGSSLDILSALQAMLRLADGMGGIDFTAVLARLALEDTSRGEESIAMISVIFGLSDLSVSEETVLRVAQVFKQILDQSLATETFQLGARAVVVDAFQAAEVPGLTARLDVLDTLALEDGITLGVRVTAVDSGAGSDLDLVRASLLLPEACAGIEDIHQIIVQLPVQDAALAQDWVSRIAAMLALSDFGQGVDAYVVYDASVQIVKLVFSLARRAVSFALAQRAMAFVFVKRAISFDLSRRETSFALSKPTQNIHLIEGANP